jgi:CRP/FNR family transcriptional regulator
MAVSVAHEGIRSALTEPQLSKLEAASELRTLKAGELLFSEGDKATHSFAVLSGAVKLTKTHPDGESRIIGLMFEGDLLCGTCGPLRTCSAEAGTDLELCAIPVEATSRLAGEAPKLERVFFQAALAELEARHDWMLLLRGSTAFQRVAGFFRLLIKRACPRGSGGRQGYPEPVHLTLPLSRAEIASFLDVTLETVSRQLTLMKKAGLIEFSSMRQVTVPDIWLLAAHAESSFQGGSWTSMPQSPYPARMAERPAA